MTTQPELDLTHGFISLVPKMVDVSRRGKQVELEVSKTLDNPKAKCSIKNIRLTYDLENRSKWKHRESTHLRIWITHKDENKNSVLAQYASRHLDSEDDRFAEYRAQFSAIVKHLYANGELNFVPTQEQLDKPTGFRWNQKAGCRCGCSPAFVAPNWLKLKSTNTITVSVEEKENEEVSLAINTARLESLKTSKPELANA
jgi:hypothetical protein